MAVVKDEAYGHGALDVVRIAHEEGAECFGLSTLEEAMLIRDAGITACRCCCWSERQGGGIAVVRGALIVDGDA